MTQHYVRFLYPGFLFSGESEEKVVSRERRPDIPDRAYAWQFFDREIVQQNGEELVGVKKNFSPLTYIGKELTAEEAIATNPDSRVLADNIEINGYKRLVKTKSGQIFPLSENEEVVSR